MLDARPFASSPAMAGTLPQWDLVFFNEKVIDRQAGMLIRLKATIDDIIARFGAGEEIGSRLSAAERQRVDYRHRCDVMRQHREMLAAIAERPNAGAVH